MQAIQVEAVSFFFPCFSFAYDTCSLVIVCLCVCMCAYTCPVYGSYVDIHLYFLCSNSFISFHQVASSLNSSYCYILHSGSTVFTWSGSLTTSDDQELVERQLDLIKV